MATPSYKDIQAFSRTSKQLSEAAKREFRKAIKPSMSAKQIQEIAVQIAAEFRIYGAELGAQWYEYCSRVAGIDIEPAVLEANSYEKARASAAAVVESGGTLTSEQAARVFQEYLERQILESIRTTGSANLHRDYERGLCSGRWARVPVGDTCAFCMMLASQGAWYLSEKSALGDTADHYHNNCDCTAVYHADANNIAGYSALFDYKEKYYSADNARRANESGKEPYPEDLAERIKHAKENHARVSDEEWTKYNEDLIVMRYKYDLK